MHLLDTNTVSELRKLNTGRANAGVVAWAATVDVADQFLSVITLQELELGILLKEKSDPTQGSILRAWMTNQVLATFQDRILPIDTSIAQRSAYLQAQRSRPALDALIASTAYVHGLVVVTRNVIDFENTGVRILNPWTIS